MIHVCGVVGRPAGPAAGEATAFAPAIPKLKAFLLDHPSLPLRRFLYEQRALGNHHSPRAVIAMCCGCRWPCVWSLA